MTTKIKYLIAINLVLVVAITISLTSNKEYSSGNNSTNRFNIPDTANVDRILIGKSELKKINSAWVLNNKYVVSPSKVKTLISIMFRLDVKRPVSEGKISKVKSQLKSEGMEVKTFENGNLTQNYWLSGTKDLTYASLLDQDPVIVHIPGYFIDIPKWYTIDQNEWRDKRIMYTNWKTLKSLSINYTNDRVNSFKISYEDPFYKVDEINQLDSAKLYNYIIQYQNFKADKFITNNKQISDSLSQTTPVCEIFIEDIYKERNNSMKIYLGPGKQYGFIKNTEELVELNPNRLRGILINRIHFQKK